MAGTNGSSPSRADDTARISLQTMNSVASDDTGRAAPVRPEDLVDAIVEKLLSKGSGGGGEPPRTFLTVDASGWAKMIVGGIVAAGLFVGTWYMTVNRDIENRPTHKQLDKRMHQHGQKPHDGAAPKAELKDMSKQIRDIEIQQGKHGTQLDSINKGIDDIKASMRIRRRR